MTIVTTRRSRAPYIVNLGGVVAPAWDGATLGALDAEIRSVFGPDEMITPDDVRRRGSYVRTRFEPARCNPVNAPGGCRDNRLEDGR